jgi:hypothetical protein
MNSYKIKLFLFIEVFFLLFFSAESYSQANTFPASGNVGIGITPTYKLDVYGPVNEWKARFQGPDGYIVFGPSNVYWAHIYTDRPAFLFNKNVWSINGGFSAYSTANLDLQTDGVTRMTILSANGSIGIGTLSPAHKLDVVGSFRSSDFIVGNQYVSVVKSGSYRVSMNGQSHGYISGRNDSSEEKFLINSNGNTYFKGGNVGIGTSIPDQALTVNGIVHAEEVIIEPSVPAPDYVFEQDYSLTPLDEVKAYITQHKHLPEVPSAKEMEKDGVKVGEMEMMLLKKVEELTLYAIEANQQLRAMRENHKKLEALVEEQKSQIEKLTAKQ